MEPMRYVAIGDSFTEGVGDWREDGTPRGWADRVAEGLAAGLDEHVWYANLAIRGRLLVPIATTQVDAALALDPLPTLLTFNGGGNDMLRPGHDTAAQMGLIRTALTRCLEAGVRPVLLSGPDPSSGLPFGPTIHARGAALTVAARDLSDDLGILFVNAFDDPVLRGAEFWSDDRLHLTGYGHARVAHLVLTALGVTAAEGDVPPPRPWRVGVLGEARYYRHHVAPWIGRRIRRTSSGKHRTGKHLDWTEVPSGGYV
ncbi:MAG: SGNH/GDSL hydrolase family protein [Propionibacteriaceae bacterium]